MYHGTGAPFISDVVDPLVIPRSVDKPRLATMVGLHTALDPAVAESVAGMRAAERLMAPVDFGPSPMGMSWEDLLRFAERTGRQERFRPTIYPLRVEGAVRPIPQVYHGRPGVRWPHRRYGLEHDDWAVAKDLIRETLDRPTFAEWAQPSLQVTRPEAEAGWDILTRARRPSSTIPNVFQRAVEEYPTRSGRSPADFVIDRDSGLYSLSPERRSDLVERYRDIHRKRGVGALGYVNTGSNEEVPVGANPLSFIVLPGAERWLGKRVGGRA